MRVEQVDFITIPTRDVARAVVFYRDVLGLPESEYRGSEIETPNVTLSLWSPEAEGIGNVLILHRRYAPRVPR